MSPLGQKRELAIATTNVRSRSRDRHPSNGKRSTGRAIRYQRHELSLGDLPCSAMIRSGSILISSHFCYGYLCGYSAKPNWRKHYNFILLDAQFDTGQAPPLPLREIIRCQRGGRHPAAQRAFNFLYPPERRLFGWQERPAAGRSPPKSPAPAWSAKTARNRQPLSGSSRRPAPLLRSESLRSC